MAKKNHPIGSELAPPKQYWPVFNRYTLSDDGLYIEASEGVREHKEFSELLGHQMLKEFVLSRSVDDILKFVSMWGFPAHSNYGAAGTKTIVADCLAWAETLFVAFRICELIPSKPNDLIRLWTMNPIQRFVAWFVMPPDNRLKQKLSTRFKDAPELNAAVAEFILTAIQRRRSKTELDDLETACLAIFDDCTEQAEASWIMSIEEAAFGMTADSKLSKPLQINDAMLGVNVTSSQEVEWPHDWSIYKTKTTPYYKVLFLRNAALQIINWYLESAPVQMRWKQIDSQQWGIERAHSSICPLDFMALALAEWLISGGPVRCCSVCLKVLPEGTRSDKDTCSSKCRQKKYDQAKTAQAQSKQRKIQQT